MKCCVGNPLLTAASEEISECEASQRGETFMKLTQSHLQDAASTQENYDALDRAKTSDVEGQALVSRVACSPTR